LNGSARLKSATSRHHAGGWDEPYGRQPEPAALGLFMGNLQPLASPDALGPAEWVHWSYLAK
jgi:hypothetical protein